MGKAASPWALAVPVVPCRSVEFHGNEQHPLAPGGLDRPGLGEGHGGIECKQAQVSVTRSNCLRRSGWL